MWYRDRQLHLIFWEHVKNAVLRASPQNWCIRVCILTKLLKRFMCTLNFRNTVLKSYYIGSFPISNFLTTALLYPFLFLFLFQLYKIFKVVMDHSWPVTWRKFNGRVNFSFNEITSFLVASSKNTAKSETASAPQETRSRPLESSLTNSCWLKYQTFHISLHKT